MVACTLNQTLTHVTSSLHFSPFPTFLSPSNFAGTVALRGLRWNQCAISRAS